MKTILIAGGTGLVGKKLQEKFETEGHEVRILSRNPKKDNEYLWNPSLHEIDKRALKNVDTIINLSGAGIADKRWTKLRKKELFDSRIQTTAFLLKQIHDLPKLECYISASGITCYGFDNDTKFYQESDPFGEDYMSQLVQNWENAADLFATHCRVVKMRISVVLDGKSGALSKMSQAIRLGFGSPLGNGKQILQWVHISDLTNAFYHVATHPLAGSFNIVGGNDSNKTFMKATAKILKKPFWMPSVPAFLLKILLGEMSMILLKGINASNQKIRNTGFEFKHVDLEETLTDLLI